MEISDNTIYVSRSPHLLTVYAMPRYGASLVLYLQGYVTFFIYTTVFKLSGTLTGICSFFGYLAIAAAQFSMGTISDRTNTRWGRRRPYVLFGTPFLLLSFFMLFTPPLFLGSHPDTIPLFVWMMVWNSGFEVFYGLVTTPYQAMLPEITEVTERPHASQLQNIWGMLGTATGLVLTFIGITSLSSQIKDTGQLSVQFILIFVLCAIVSAFFFLFFCWKMPRELPKYGSQEKVATNLKQSIQNRNFLRITIFHGIASLPPTSAMALGFVQYVLHFSTITLVVAAVVLLFTILGFLIIWRKLIERRGKKYTLQIILLVGIIVLPFSLIGIAQDMNPTIYSIIGIIFVVLVAVNIAGWSMFPSILYADLTEDDARRTDNFKAGVYTGFPSIPLNIFQGISIIITGLLTDSLPLLANTGVSWYYVLWGPLSAIYLMIAITILRKWIVLDFSWEKNAKLDTEQ
ncbi:MAG TPA: MFS transporter [Candidatus Lokiarchaeia archaeon]|nr:MFS transporter [Candidatus Lokiarchaeia archaeon]